MKKLMFTAAVAAAMGAFAGIESNTVGFKTYALDTSNPDDYVHNIGVQYKNLATVDNSYTISNSIFEVTLEDGDNIFIFDPLFYGYSLYTYVADFGDGTTGFLVTTADGADAGTIATLTVNKGDNILYMPVSLDTTPNVSGGVQDSGSVTLTFTVEGDDYIFPITNPFPKATTLADLTCLADGDQIFVWDSVYYGYTLLTYLDMGGGVMGFDVTYADGSTGEPIIDSSTVIFGEGQGGLYMPTDSRTWTVTLNY